MQLSPCSVRYGVEEHDQKVMFEHYDLVNTAQADSGQSVQLDSCQLGTFRRFN